MDETDDDALVDLVTVTHVRVLGRYILELAFDTGEVRVLDMEPLMRGPVFQPLLSDYALFCQVTVDPGSGTVLWPNGADWAPDELYSRSKSAVPFASRRKKLD
ncbi:DUF2442 domain-containing protein [Nocardioides sp. NPDC092400]|uniref:DUF2442 domain-containing protein n=1 Tax=Nocardioides sp. NPDC092400 TaxID=3155196 RepID=UPI0034150987